MSYIKINIGGKDRGLKFNQGALVTFQGKIDPDNVAGTTGYALIWAGLKANCYVKGEEFTETFETVCDWVDELPEEVIMDVVKTFQETQAYQKLIPEGKKKSMQKSTKRNALK